ncbi:MAG TPA: DEAD/DEAH box helicase [Chitinispirillaceae bacterium]|nr:DEAD/DEAH box helicase [Chitinispirillaceae bacterium]
MKFNDYNISKEIKHNLAQAGFIRPTDIQFKSIPSIMKGEDVLAIAQTGTGKTAAFAIPLIDKLHSYKMSRRSNGISCLVMVPTRELARQIGDVFNSIAKGTRTKVFCLYGGVEQDAQVKRLQDGIDILIATPGRMFDLINQGYISLNNINVLVLDEADQMLDLGFIDDIKYVKKMLVRRHQTLFFSATINREIKKLAFAMVNSNAIRIQISPEDPVSRNVTHYVMFVELDDKRFFLQKFIKDNKESKILVFVRTRVRAQRVFDFLKNAGIDSLTIHGEKDQQERNAVLLDFKNGTCPILIATDLTARGIDIPDINYVINYDLPEKEENYVHRVGRTGRGVKKGSAISYCSSGEKEILEKIQQFLNKKIEEIKVSKKEYAHTLEKPKEQSLQELIDEHEAWKKGRKKKKNIFL